jgi:hypothetical protein
MAHLQAGLSPGFVMSGAPVWRNANQACVGHRQGQTLPASHFLDLQ